MMRSNLATLLAISLLSLGACGGDTGSSQDALRAECNPLGGPACMMPWPSSAYLVSDDSTSTGYRVDIPTEAMPINADDIRIDNTGFNAYDGFGVGGPMIVDFPTGVAVEGLPSAKDIAASLETNSSIIVLNMATGEPLPIFAEPDMNAAVPEERALIIRPMTRMESGTRYAVGIRNTVKAADGTELPVPEGFAKILAGEELSHPLYERLGNYDEIFSALDGAGMPKDELVLAWDFVTASDEFLTSDLMTMRTKALDAMDGATISYEFEEHDVSGSPHAYRLIEGTFDVPMFLSNGEENDSIIVRDAAGAPELQGMGTAEVAALIPKCVETAPLPIPVVIFGHGMFGNATGSLDGDFIQRFADEECTILVGSDWIGLTNRQFASVAFAMNDLNRGTGITEKMAQGVINFIALQETIRSTFVDADEFKIEGQQIIDPTNVSYFGASLGGILGSVFMSYDPFVTRGALGVPGAPWSLLFERSVFWPPLRITMKGAYPEPWDYQQNVVLMGMLFEKVDPIATAHRVIDDPLEGTPEKQLLVYMALGDALVAKSASDVMARSLDIPVIGPSVEVPFGLIETMETTPSGYTIYDEDPDNLPPESNAMLDLEFNSTHGDVHKWGAVQRQVFGFLKSGEIVSECSVDDAPAPCFCPSGACQ